MQNNSKYKQSNMDDLVFMHRMTAQTYRDLIVCIALDFGNIYICQKFSTY